MTFEKAMEEAFEVKAMGIMEKNGKYQTAQDWKEIEYAERCGWNYVGHPADIKEKA